MPFILRSKPTETSFFRMTARAARNKRRLLYYSPFRAYRAIPGKPGVQQVILRCADLFSRQNRINRRNAAEIPVFPLCPINPMRQMYMYNLCHISLFTATNVPNNHYMEYI